LKKEQAKAYLEDESIPFDLAMSAVVLKHLVREDISVIENLEIIQQADAQRQKLLFPFPTIVTFSQLK
jgi:hypothetical protein